MVAVGLVSKILRRVALVFTAVFAVAGLLFALGYAFEDPGGWPAVAITCALGLPLVGLVLVVALVPRVAFWLLLVAVVIFAGWAVAVLLGLRVDLPVTPLVALVLSVPVAVHGQRHPGRAAVLMFVLAAVPFVLVVARMVGAAGVGRPGLGALLGGSTGVVVFPLVVLAALFAVAALVRESASPPGPAGATPGIPSGV